MSVAITARDAVLHVTIDRPDRRNALDMGSVREIIEALESAAIDESLRAVLLRGAGEDFCTGADLVAGGARDGEKPRTGSIQRRTPVQAHRLVALLMELQLPVVAR